MTNILKIDTSLRSGISGTHPHGSLSRRLTELFIQQWRENDSSIDIKYRDLGQDPIPYIDEEWIISEFGYAESEEKAQQRLKLSDELIEEIILPNNERYQDRFRDYRLDSEKLESLGIHFATFEEDVNEILMDFGWKKS